MTQPGIHTVRLKVSPRAALIIGPGASRDAQLAAARGALQLDGADQLTVLGVLCASADAEVKQAALSTLRTTPVAALLPVFDDPALHPGLLELLVRLRLHDVELMDRVIDHPAASAATLSYLAEWAPPPVQERLTASRNRSSAGRHLPQNGPQPEPELAAGTSPGEFPDDTEEEQEPFPAAVDGNPDELEEVCAEALAARLQEAEEQGVSKYQLVMELKVSEKIKIAMTGDREWRKILIKEPNRLVHGAVLKNGRITEAEVVMVAKNKSASDEMVRLILLNREWVKNYEIRKALVTHPKTPLPRALRFIGDLTLRDLKELMRNRNVSNAIASTARREFERRSKRGA